MIPANLAPRKQDGEREHTQCESRSKKCGIKKGSAPSLCCEEGHAKPWFAGEKLTTNNKNRLRTGEVRAGTRRQNRPTRWIDCAFSEACERTKQNKVFEREASKSKAGSRQVHYLQGNLLVVPVQRLLLVDLERVLRLATGAGPGLRLRPATAHTERSKNRLASLLVRLSVIDQSEEIQDENGG